MTQSSDSGSDRGRVADLVEQFKSLEAAGAAKAGHPDHRKRDEVLEELQDAVGLGGRMVMEKDILRRAEQILRP